MDGESSLPKDFEHDHVVSVDTGDHAQADQESAPQYQTHDGVLTPGPGDDMQVDIHESPEMLLDLSRAHQPGGLTDISDVQARSEERNFTAMDTGVDDLHVVEITDTASADTDVAVPPANSLETENYSVPRVVWAEMSGFDKYKTPFWWPALQMGYPLRPSGKIPVCLIGISGSEKHYYSEEAEANAVLVFRRRVSGAWMEQEVPPAKAHKLPVELDMGDRSTKARNHASVLDSNIDRNWFSMESWLRMENEKKRRANADKKTSIASGSASTPEVRAAPITQTVSHLANDTAQSSAIPTGPAQVESSALSVDRSTAAVALDGRDTSIDMAAPSLASPSSSTGGTGSSVDEYDDVCDKCHKAGDSLIMCEGSCKRCWHRECLTPDARPADDADFYCDDCTNASWACAYCHRQALSSEPLVKCTDSYCGKRYHKQCISNLPLTKHRLDEEKIVCPRHFCGMCEGAINLAKDSSFTWCLRCPVAYHRACLPPGVIQLDFAEKHFVCSKHVVADEVVNRSSRNFNRCVACDGGGDLLCCDGCPAAFHESEACISKFALNLKGTLKNGRWYCRNCTAGRMPAREDVVWAKQGSYPFWPAEVYPADDVAVPERLLKVDHKPHETIAVRWYPTNKKEDIWAWLGNSHIAPIDQQKYDDVKQDRASYREALKQAEKVVKRQLTNPILPADDVRARDPPKYIRISANSYLVEKPQGGPNAECNCKVERPCVDNTCLNRLMQYECPRTCQTDSLCQNQRFTKRQYKKVKAFYTGNRGWGVKAAENIAEGDFIIEYVGEVVDRDLCEHRIATQRLESENDDWYVMCVDENVYIDSSLKGNVSRFINHSCAPNCEVQMWVVNESEKRMGIFALTNIAAGEEITYKYNLKQLDPVDTVTRYTECRCAAPNCSGFIGKKLGKDVKVSAVVGRRRELIDGTAAASVDLSKEKSPASKSAKKAARTPTPAKTSTRVATRVESSGRAGTVGSSSRGDARKVKALLPRKVKLEDSSGDSAGESNSSDEAPGQKRVPSTQPTNGSSLNARGSVKRARAGHNERCFSCGQPETASRLFMTCDIPACGKKYHEACVEMEGVRKPQVWKCSRHFCGECENPPVRYCSKCPHAYCQEHRTYSIFDRVNSSGVSEPVCYDCISQERKRGGLVSTI
ncbi:Histone-lysine N-methyltransferase, H3 lysine-36 and H4 lysine-20 specific [Porphyridium purpureum]|uniref:Histone-lysine N-methyltransferase, H3 lysine-36 and H4 lysine-20 specific n=1 Tax=Porphyridium purpureum TaxID=35688 RepID=A0A5J4YXZ6_PORPP|nr:Histone-lysine N-methyltransferase, H3 lysine-36 and H4 lysine-20 specific [Porphyridium purpureum]|eukprot:POR7062..scf209_3